jgi:ABC-2 type transport system permease protein
MQDGKQNPGSLALTLVLVGLNLIALNYLVSGWSTARIDLTEEGVFSISPATKRLLRSLEEDLTIHGYFSTRTHPKLAPLIPEIVDLLDEYRAVADGRVVVEIIDPGENEAAEEEAADRFGVRSTPFRLASKYESGIVNAYFALVVRYGDQYVRYGFEDLIEVEALPDGDIDVRLRNLEYDLTRAIKKSVHGFQSTAELFERVEQPVRLVAIVTPDVLPEILSEVPDALRLAAEELAQKGGDKFVYEEIDLSATPERQAELEARYGLRPMTLGLFSAESFYLYGFLEVAGRLEQLVLTSESITAAAIREAIENSLRRHTPGFLKTVGVVTSDPPEIPPQVRMQMQLPPQPPPEFQDLKGYLQQEYQVKDVSLDGPGGVPSDVDVLLVLKPKNLTEAALFALDQYVMRGGRVVLASGAFEADFNQQGLRVAPVTSGLDEWLAHHGVTIGETLVLDDRNQALPLPEVRYTALGAIRTWSLAPYPYLVQVREDGFLNRDVTASLDSVGIYWGSPLTVDESVNEETEAMPLLQSSARSWTNADLGAVSYVDYEVPVEGTEPQLLAVALSGRFKSYFADRLPEPEEPPVSDPDSGETVEDDEAPDVARSLPIVESPETRLAVIGNAEFLSDFVARSLGQLDGGFFVENLRFVENLIDWVGLDSEMLGIRSRGLASRRLERIEPRSQVSIEAVNYLVPVLALFGLAAHRYWRRRSTTPLLNGPGGVVSSAATTREGVGR